MNNSEQDYMKRKRNIDESIILKNTLFGCSSMIVAIGFFLFVLYSID